MNSNSKIFSYYEWDSDPIFSKILGLNAPFLLKPGETQNTAYFG